MHRYVAFLRGMNTGRRRITNADLCSRFETLGFAHVSAFLASGNVVFEARSDDAAAVSSKIEAGLRAQLDYEVPTFLRTAKEVRAIAAFDAFADTDEALAGKPQVVFLARRPTAAVRKRVLALDRGPDHVVVRDRELHWWPAGSILESGFDFKAVEKILGPTTTRTRNTVVRLAAKFLSD